MATNVAPDRGTRPETATDPDGLDRTAAGTAETDRASGIDDPREPDSLDGYRVTNDGIADGASDAGEGAYGEQNEAARDGSDGGAGNARSDEGLADRLRTPGSPV